MEIPRPPQPQPTTPGPDRLGGRLNLLLSAAGLIPWRDDSWADALPRLLEPMGVRTYRVHSGVEATRLLHDTAMHIALVDLALPLDESDVSAAGFEGGPHLLRLLHRLPDPPPTVIVKHGRTQREDARTLSSALVSGAFAVLERPVQLETVLEVMRRILCRHYANRWPGCA